MKTKMKMKKMIVYLMLLISMIPCAIGSAAAPDTYSIPQSFDLGKNYYNGYGSPDLNANIIGSREFDRDQTVILNIGVMNKGKLLGFKNDRTPYDSDEIYAAQTEMKLESSIVDATNVIAALSVDPGIPIEVKSVSQQIGSIKSGENALAPVKFDVKIDKKAKAGEYNLYLNLSYDYQKNVQITNPDSVAQTYDVNHWYGMMNQNQTLKIRVKDQADFEIVNTTGSLYPGKENVIDIVIKNTGEEVARDVKVIINPADPLSTTDCTAYLSTIEPGGTAIAHVKIKADGAAVPKIYGVDTVLKYETPEGDTNYSDIMEAPVEVKQTGFFQSIFGWL
jgi:hypothetical protein